MKWTFYVEPEHWVSSFGYFIVQENNKYMVYKGDYNNWQVSEDKIKKIGEFDPLKEAKNIK